MSNPIKYSTSAETLALKSGNFYIGTGDVGKGPTNTTGYYNGITPPSGGYTIYLNKVSGGPSIYVADNDSQLISLTNSIAGASYTTVAQCLQYYVGQTDKMCVNIDYPAIPTDGLVMTLDAGFNPSYPTTGTTWYNMSGTNNCTLVNGPTYNSANGGSIVFDSTDDTSTFPVNTFNSGAPQDGTYYFRIKYPTYTSTQTILFNENGGGFGSGIVYYYNPGTTGRYWFVIYFNNTSAGTGNILGIFDGLTAGSWFDVAITFDSTGKWATYKNGALNTSGTVANFSSWRRTGNGTPGFRASSSLGSGNSQLFYYYNRALSASEILQIFNATKDRVGL